MALEIQHGLAQVHGIRNNGTPISITGVATFLLDSAKATHKFDMEAGKDELGFDANLTAVNPHVEFDIAFRPAGADRDAAEAVAAFLEPLATVTLANFALDEFNGDCIYVGDGQIDLSSGKAATQSLKLRKYKDATQNTLLTTTVEV